MTREVEGKEGARLPGCGRGGQGLSKYYVGSVRVNASRSFHPRITGTRIHDPVIISGTYNRGTLVMVGHLRFSPVFPRLSDGEFLLGGGPV